MAIVLSAFSSLVAGWFAFDLIRSAAAKRRPHTAAYAAGMTMFAAATLASFLSIAFGWTDAIYKIFYLFGGVLNVPFLALGSVYLVGGERWGRAMLGLLLALYLDGHVAGPARLPWAAIPDEILPRGSEIFASGGITTLVAIGSRDRRNDSHRGRADVGFPVLATFEATGCRQPVDSRRDLCRGRTADGRGCDWLPGAIHGDVVDRGQPDLGRLPLGSRQTGDHHGPRAGRLGRLHGCASQLMNGVADE